MKWYLFLFALTCCGLTAEAKTGTINLSHDLVRLGIASEDLAPNDPSLDARPLFQAALQYAATHHAALLTLDPGNYYFLTPQNSTTYLSFPGVSDLTVDLAGSTIYFAGAFLQGFSLVDCQRVTLTNFNVDFLVPPYTYVQLAAVNPDARTLAYGTLPGWPDPGSLTSPDGVSVVLWAVAFRDGEIVPGTSRMQVAQPVTGDVLTLVQDHTPWTQSATLTTLQPGDTIVVTQRGGSPPVIVTRGDSITISDASIYGAGAIAVLLNTVSNSLVESVSVLPREGNLTSSNADGIHFVDVGANNHIRYCSVTGTLDDALVMDSYDLATTVASTQSGATQITVQRTAYLRFPNGSQVNFVDPSSANEVTGATIVAQDPPDSSSPVFAGTVTLTFDQPIPALAVGSGMAFASPEQRGAGSSIENNRVAEIPFGRGIWIGGAEGIKIKDNKVVHTSNGGIVVYEGVKSYPTPPAHGIRIKRNVVKGSLGPMASGSGTQIALGGIMVDSVNDTGEFVSSAPNTDISILDNRVVSSGRCGIWVGQVNGGTVKNNAVTRYGQYPNLPLFGVSAAESTALVQDFGQPIVTHDNQNVSVSDNLTSP